MVTWQFQIVFYAINFNKKQCSRVCVAVDIIFFYYLCVHRLCIEHFMRQRNYYKVHVSIGIRSLTDYFDANEKILKIQMAYRCIFREVNAWKVTDHVAVTRQPANAEKLKKKTTRKKEKTKLTEPVIWNIHGDNRMGAD